MSNPSIKTAKEENTQFVIQLIEKEYDELYRFLLKKLGNDEDETLECLSQIYTTALKKSDILRTHANPTGWLYKTAQLCAKHILSSRKSRVQTISLDSVIDTLVYEQNFYDELSDEQLQAAKQKCLSVLSDIERETYDLFYTQKLSIKQISIKLGVSESAIGTRLYRIRTKLIDEVNKFF